VNIISKSVEPEATKAHVTWNYSTILEFSTIFHYRAMGHAFCGLITFDLWPSILLCQFQTTLPTSRPFGICQVLN